MLLFWVLESVRFCMWPLRVKSIFPSTSLGLPTINPYDFQTPGVGFPVQHPWSRELDLWLGPLTPAGEPLLLYLLPLLFVGHSPGSIVSILSLPLLPISLWIHFFFKLKYSWFIMLCYFLVYSKSIMFLHISYIINIYINIIIINISYY